MIGKLLSSITFLILFIKSNFLIFVSSSFMEIIKFLILSNKFICEDFRVGTDFEYINKFK